MEPAKRQTLSVLCWTFLLYLYAATVAHAGPTDPIVGEAFDHWVRSQRVELQEELSTLFPEETGHVVLGPIDPLYEGSADARHVYHSLRVLCPSLTGLDLAVERFSEQGGYEIRRSRRDVESSRQSDPAGYRGVVVEIETDTGPAVVQFSTLQQTRWLIWARRCRSLITPEIDARLLDLYARNVSDYLFDIDQGKLDAAEPGAVDAGLPEPLSLYATPPPYVHDEYQDYKDLLRRHAVIHTEFARGVMSFVPSDSLLNALKENAPRAAYPNKEYPVLQAEFRKFIERGGRMADTETLTSERFGSLEAGEYLFVLGVSGRIRFGREIPREEVRRIEAETGRKLARANHAFLFPGEPVLTAGTFWIERNGPARLSHVDAQSGHYFYSDLTRTIREDITVRSNHYLLTVGHFFTALDRAGIAYGAVLISK